MCVFSTEWISFLQITGSFKKTNFSDSLCPLSPYHCKRLVNQTLFLNRLQRWHIYANLCLFIQLCSFCKALNVDNVDITPNICQGKNFFTIETEPISKQSMCVNTSAAARWHFHFHKKNVRSLIQHMEWNNSVVKVHCCFRAHVRNQTQE